jgi:alkylhydroperoxidase/carboxymuconolactone decarboxylase family protein YurZ
MPARDTGRYGHPMERVVSDRLERLLRRIALDDQNALRSSLADEDCPSLDDRTDALVRLGALISLGASTTSYRCAVERAYATGATDEDILGTLSAVAPAAGRARTVAAAPGLALALGYDVEDDLT